MIRLLTPINLGAYKENLQPFAIIDIFQDMEYHYGTIMEKIKFADTAYQASSLRCLVFTGTNCCSSVLETVGIRDPTRNIRNFTMFSRSSSHCPSSRCVPAGNAVCKSTDIYRNSGLNINNPNYSLFHAFVLRCLIAAVICIRGDSVTGHLAIELARN
jgi:hypothetical protein